MAKKYDSLNTMQESMYGAPKWQCENCGKIYPLYQKMINTPCHSHPKGAWKGNCMCSQLTIPLGTQVEMIYERKQRKQEQEKQRKQEQEKQDPHLAQAILFLQNQLFPNTNLVQDVSITSLIVAMLNQWQSENAANTRKVLKESCSDFLLDLTLNMNIFCKKRGINESVKDNLEHVRASIDDIDYWRKMYCFFWGSLVDEKYYGLFTEKPSEIKDPYVSTWPFRFCILFINICIKVIQNPDKASAQEKEMFENMVKHHEFNAWQVGKGYTKSIPKEFAGMYEKLVSQDLRSKDFLFDMYCFLRLELKQYYLRRREGD